MKTRHIQTPPESHSPTATSADYLQPQPQKSPAAVTKLLPPPKKVILDAAPSQTINLPLPSPQQTTTLPPSSAVTSSHNNNNNNNGQHLQPPDKTPMTPTTPNSIKRFFRKATKEDGMDKVLETVNFEEKFSSLPEFNPLASPSHVGNAGNGNGGNVVTVYTKSASVHKNKHEEDDLGSDATATPR